MLAEYMFAIYIESTRAIPYAAAIVEGFKTMETRKRDVFKSIFEYNNTAAIVAVIQTGRGKAPEVIGYITLHKGRKIWADQFQSKENFEKHLIPPGSKYDIGNAAFKWAYECSNATPCKPYPVPENKINHGRSYCEIPRPDYIKNDLIFSC